MALIKYPNKPILTLRGAISSQSIGISKYGISDSTGLGPNGADLYKTFSVTITDIEYQPTGDSSLRFSNGLNTGGGYNAIDIEVGDLIANEDATRIFQIVSISSKTATSLELVYEDTYMSVAKDRPDRINYINQGTPVIIFKTNENNELLLSSKGAKYFTGERSIARLNSYLNRVKPATLFHFAQATGPSNLSPGDIVTSDGGTGDYYLRKISSNSDIVIGEVSQNFGGTDLIIRPHGKIINEFDSPSGLSGGQIGSIWYSDGSGGYNLTSVSNKPLYFQITNRVKTEVIGDVDDPKFNQTLYSLDINGTAVIPVSATGPVYMNLSTLVNKVNSYTYLTDVEATQYSIYGDNVRAVTDPIYTSYGGNIVAYMSGSTGATGSYPASDFSFSIKDDAGTVLFISPDYADELDNNDYPVTSAGYLADLINSAASINGANISASYSSGSFVITETSGGDLNLDSLGNDAFGNAPFGNEVTRPSVFGILEGLYEFIPGQLRLGLTNNFGGPIIVGGTWVTLDPLNSAGIYSNFNGNPPKVLVIGSVGSGGGTGGTNWNLEPNEGLELTGDSLGTKYNTTIGDSVESVIVGGAPATPASVWKTKSIVDALDTILFPTIEATATTTKSVSLTVDNTTGVLEIGRTFTRILTASFNDGAITNGGGTAGPDLVGGATGYSFSGTGITTTEQAGATLGISDISIVSGTNNWAVTAYHEAGTGDYYNNKGAIGTNLDALRVSGTSNDPTSSPSITGVYPYFWIKSSSPLTAGDLVNAIENGTANKTVASSTGTITIGFSAAGEYLAVAYPSSSTTKTKWYVTPLNAGDIPGGVFGSASLQDVDSYDGYWTSVSYKIHITAGPITESEPMQLRNS